MGKKRKRRKQLHDELYNMLWRFRFGGGTSTHEMADILADFIDERYVARRPWLDQKQG